MSKPHAWVVQCNECGCIVTCRAADPQAHMQDPEPRPTCRLLVTCSCCWTAWLYPPEAMFNGEPAPSPECFKRARQSARTENAKLIAAAVIAGIRLNKRGNQERASGARKNQRQFEIGRDDRHKNEELAVLNFRYNERC